MKKLLNKKGFTLMEMLIVVAIIAILVAISIPTFTGSLDKANSATDKANLRAAKGLVVNAQLDSSVTSTGYYNIESGKIEATANANSKGKCKNHSNAYIKVTTDGAVWVDATNESTTVTQECSN